MGSLARFGLHTPREGDPLCIFQHVGFFQIAFRWLPVATSENVKGDSYWRLAFGRGVFHWLD